jgi:hypothetical protein
VVGPQAPKKGPSPEPAGPAAVRAEVLVQVCCCYLYWNL